MKIGNMVRRSKYNSHLPQSRSFTHMRSLVLAQLYRFSSRSKSGEGNAPCPQELRQIREELRGNPSFESYNPQAASLVRSSRWRPLTMAHVEQSESPFFSKLPGEIRNLIYSFANDTPAKVIEPPRSTARFSCHTKNAGSCSIAGCERCLWRWLYLNQFPMAFTCQKA